MFFMRNILEKGDYYHNYGPYRILLLSHLKPLIMVSFLQILKYYFSFNLFYKKNVFSYTHIKKP